MDPGVVLLAVAAFAIIASIWMTSERPIKNTVQQEQTAGEAERPRGDDEPNSPSSDFAALINAIASEGAANRSEEKSEDSGKKLRDWITIALLIATTGGIYWQVHEMIKAYEPIAETAKTAKNNMVADHRAWIGVTLANIELPAIDKPIHARIFYNMGRQPAPLSLAFRPIVFSLNEWYGGQAFATLAAERDHCFSMNRMDPTLIVFPGTNATGYTFDEAFTDAYGSSLVNVDQDVVSGHKVVAVIGCFLYKSYDEIRHTSYCGFDLNVKTVSTALAFCTAGNDAD